MHLVEIPADARPDFYGFRRFETADVLFPLDNLARDWLNWLAAQRDWQGQAVPPQMLGEIRHEHARLMLVRERLDELVQASAAADPTPAAVQMTERSELLLRLKPRNDCEAMGQKQQLCPTGW